MNENTRTLPEFEASRLVASMARLHGSHRIIPLDIQNVTIEPGVAMLVEPVNGSPYVFVLPKTVISFDPEPGSGTDKLRCRIHAGIFYEQTVQNHKSAAALAAIKSSATSSQSPGAPELVIQPLKMGQRAGASSAAVASKSDSATFGAPNIKHPFSDYSLSDAVQVAKGIASLNNESVDSLAVARAIVERSAQNSGHNWITGAVALDVLDAAIDGRDLRVSNRIISSEEPESENPNAIDCMPESTAIEAVAAYIAASDDVESRHLDTANPEGFPDDHFFERERKAWGQMMTSLNVLSDAKINEILATHQCMDHDGSSFQVVVLAQVRDWQVKNAPIASLKENADAVSSKSASRARPR